MMRSLAHTIGTKEPETSGTFRTLRVRGQAMSWDAEPVVGQWYRHLEKDYEFKVIAVDEDEGIVQIQYLDDEVEELDIDSWYEWDVEKIAPYDRSARVHGGIADNEDLPEKDEDAANDSSSYEEQPDENEEDDELNRWDDR